ncbi:MAG: hypothetical protein SVU69_12625 [Pseudomonadota bacterium]|nr:hypothetical protein [Pseudomonadota bacterium]
MHTPIQPLITLLVICLLTLASHPARSGDNPGADELANYAFANYLGTGIYSVAGRAVQVYRLPIAVNLREETPDRLGYKLRLPLTLGFFDFKAEDLIDEGLPDDVATVTFVPGLEAVYTALPGWEIKPFVDFGLARNLSGGEDAYLYGLGARHQYRFRWRRQDWTYGNALYFAGNRGVDSGAVDNFGAFETGLAWDLPWYVRVGKRRWAANVYLANYVYLGDLELVRTSLDPVTVDTLWEVGTTIGTRRVLRLWFIDMPRVGIGVRFGDDFSALRIVLGMPF